MNETAEPGPFEDNDLAALIESHQADEALDGIIKAYAILFKDNLAAKNVSFAEEANFIAARAMLDFDTNTYMDQAELSDHIESIILSRDFSAAHIIDDEEMEAIREQAIDELVASRQANYEQVKAGYKNTSFVTYLAWMYHDASEVPPALSGRQSGYKKAAQIKLIACGMDDTWLELVENHFPCEGLNDLEIVEAIQRQSEEMDDFAIFIEGFEETIFELGNFMYSQGAMPLQLNERCMLTELALMWHKAPAGEPSLAEEARSVVMRYGCNTLQWAALLKEYFNA